MKILNGDVMDHLRTLPDESVHCCVTSPPYWGLRDYSRCGCAVGKSSDDVTSTLGSGGNVTGHIREPNPLCPICHGTGKIAGMERQLGLEPTPEEYISNLTQVFHEVKRVLRKDGTCWVNIGDCYSGGTTGRNDVGSSKGDESGGINKPGYGGPVVSREIPDGLKPKDLVGQPWRLAFALQADGWYLRSDIIWAKPNPMPESVTDRPTKAHEYIFLLSKSPRYFYDQEAVREPNVRSWDENNGGSISTGRLDGIGAMGGMKSHPKGYPLPNPAGRNSRTVWEIATQPYPEAHFATFPEELPRRCIKAGTSEKGCCPKCGSPWERVIENPKIPSEMRNRDDSTKMSFKVTQVGGGQKIQEWRDANPPRTVGWRPTCECANEPPCHNCSHSQKEALGNRGIEMFCIKTGLYRHKRCEDYDGPASSSLEPIPCVVLDPFAGSGTTGAVARGMGRSSILIELNPEYVKLIKDRVRADHKPLEVFI